MVADVQLGRGYTPTIYLEDASGSPLAGAVTGGTLNVYGPNSATTVAATGTSTDKGYGRFGVALAASDLATAGWYRYVVPTITVGGLTFLNQGGWFRVGDIPPEYRSLRDILTRVMVGAGMAIASVSTSSGSTTTLKDTRWFDAGLSSAEFVGDELLIVEPGAVTDATPVRVTGFDPTTGSVGTFTFTPAVTSTASGTDYLLIRASRFGDRYAQVRALVDDAIADLCTRETATDDVTLTATNQTTDYTLPAAFLSIDRVQYDPLLGGQYEAWQEVAPLYYEAWADRRTLRFLAPIFDVGTPLKVTGKVGTPPPRALSDLVHAPATAIIDLVAGSLALPPQQRAGLRLGRASRAQRRGGEW